MDDVQELIDGTGRRTILMQTWKAWSWYWLLEFYTMPATKILVVSGMKEARKPEQLEEGYTGLLRPQLQVFIY